MISAKERLKASAWLAQLKQHNDPPAAGAAVITGGPSAPEPVVPEAIFEPELSPVLSGSADDITKHYEDKLDRAKVQLQQQYKEKLREHQEEQKLALQQARGEAHDRGDLLKGMAEASKQKVDTLKKQVEDLEAKKAAQQKEFKEQLASARHKMQAVLAEHDKVASAQMSALKTKTAAVMKQMTDEWQHKEALLKAQLPATADGTDAPDGADKQAESAHSK